MSLEDVLSGNNPLGKLPGHITIRTDGWFVEHDRAKINELRETFRRAQQAYDETKNDLRFVDVKDLRRIKCTNAPCGREFFGKLTIKDGALPMVTGKCPECGKEYRIESENLT